MNWYQWPWNCSSPLGVGTSSDSGLTAVEQRSLLDVRDSGKLAELTGRPMKSGIPLCSDRNAPHRATNPAGKSFMDGLGIILQFAGGANEPLGVPKAPPRLLTPPA